MNVVCCKRFGCVMTKKKDEPWKEDQNLVLHILRNGIEVELDVCPNHFGRSEPGIYKHLDPRNYEPGAGTL